MTAETIDLRSRSERAVRRAWRSEPGPWLRIAGVLYALVEDARHALHDAGVLAAWHPGVPVVSVGGLSVGGSGKTPLAAVLARWLHDAGVRPAVVTHGYEDEMSVHRALLPDGVPVVGGRGRERAARRAVELGAGAVVVDSGFQRRRLARDLDVLAVATSELTGHGLRLPAGPLREGWSAALRADALVLVRRCGRPAVDAGTRRWLRGRLPGTPTADLRLVPGALRPANDAARDREPDAPVAVSSVMDPEGFLAALRDREVRPEARFVLPDHGDVDEALADRILERAGGRGIVCTLKERDKLAAPVGERAPLWWLEDQPRWEAGAGGLRRLVLETAGADA